MTEQLLRNALVEAQEKEQLCLFIWANWTVWDDFADDMNPGNEIYDFTLSQISDGEEATVSVRWNGLSMPGILAVSVQKLQYADELILQVVNACKKGHYNGPISLVPLNKISDFC